MLSLKTSTQHWYSIEDWGPPRSLAIIQEVSQGNLEQEKKTELEDGEAARWR